MRFSLRRQGSAIVMVLAFITFVAIVAGGIAYLSSGRRRVEAMSMSDYRAFETASSCIDYAARQLTLDQVIPGDAPRFLEMVRMEDEAGLRGICGPCSEWRTLKDSDGKDAGKVWTAWTFPAAQSARVDVGPVRDLAKRDTAVVEVSPVTAKPLRWRRDLVVGRWQSFGVVRFESVVQVQDAFGKTTLTLLADRMFTLEVKSDPQDGHITEAKLVVSNQNLRTGVRKS